MQVFQVKIQVFSQKNWFINRKTKTKFFNLESPIIWKTKIFKMINQVFQSKNQVFRIIRHCALKKLVFRSKRHVFQSAIFNNYSKKNSNYWTLRFQNVFFWSKNQVFQTVMSNNSINQVFQSKNQVFCIIIHCTLKKIVFSIEKPSFSMRTVQ